MTLDSVDGDIEQPQNDAETESTTVEREVETQEQSVETTQEAQEPKRNRVQERINQLTREKREQAQRAQAAEEKLKSLESNANTVTPSNETLQAPKESDFEDYRQYEIARDDYLLDRASEKAYERIKSENEKRDAQLKADAEINRAKTAQENLNRRVNELSGSIENVAEVVYGDELGSFLDADLAFQIAELEKNVEVAYHLANHLDQADKLRGMSPVQRARELAKLEMSVELPTGKSVSNAPDPIKPVDGATVTDEWGKLAAGATFE